MLQDSKSPRGSCSPRIPRKTALERLRDKQAEMARIEVENAAHNDRKIRARMRGKIVVSLSEDQEQARRQAMEQSKAQKEAAAEELRRHSKAHKRRVTVSGAKLQMALSEDVEKERQRVADEARKLK
eukprot:g2090.t1